MVHCQATLWSNSRCPGWTGSAWHSETPFTPRLTFSTKYCQQHLDRIYLSVGAYATVSKMSAWLHPTLVNCDIGLNRTLTSDESEHPTTPLFTLASCAWLAQAVGVDWTNVATVDQSHTRTQHYTLDWDVLVCQTITWCHIAYIKV